VHGALLLPFDLWATPDALERLGITKVRQIPVHLSIILYASV